MRQFTRCLLAGVLACQSLAWAAKPRPEEIQILGLVAGRAVSDRQVEIDLILENPELYQKSGVDFVNTVLLESGLNRVITQTMVMEELKVIGESRITAKELEAEVNLLRKKMGAKAWKQFLDSYSINEAQVRDRMAEKIQVQRAIDDRVKLALASAGVEPTEKITTEKRETLMRKSIQEWVVQLKNRYRVQIFRYKK